jgi:crotonobetainyl-CoA:carnitine CoA-transferase CaiB-like acyl-CoA transferase
LLADLGADVIRIEKVTGSEDRFIVPLREDGDGGALYLQVNRSKRGMTLDPMKPQAAEIVRRLVATSDVVVANLPTQSLEAMGLNYPALSAVKPDVILTTVNAFWTSGPWSDRLGFDGIGQAMSGAAYLSGRPEEPVKSYVQWVDFTAASFAAFGTLAALMQRSRSGRGQHVEASLLGSALTVANSVLMEESVLGVGRIASGNRAQVAAPADIFATSNGWIIVQAVGRPLFRRLARLIEHPHWLDDRRFETDASRGDHRDELCEAVAEWCRSRTTDAALDAMAEAGVPAGPVLAPHEALAHPQVAGVGFLNPTPYPGLGSPAPVASFPVDMSETPVAAPRAAPQLGEHTNEVLSELGFGQPEIASLRASRVV